MTLPVSRKMAVDCLLALATIECSICHEHLKSGEEIQFDHIHAIVHGGPHEYQNLRPVHADCHKKKTSRDIKDNAKVKRILAGGRKKRGPKMKSRGFSKKLTKKFDGSVKESRG